MAALSLRHNVERMVFPPPIRPLRGATLFPATLAVDGCLHPQRCWAREDNIAQDAIIWKEESSVTTRQWMDGRRGAGLTQVEAARLLDVSQPYLSQLENGTRDPSDDLARRAVKVYQLPATALPLASSATVQEWSADELENRLAALGYPGFSHRRTNKPANPADVVLGALVQRDLDTRLVEALPWVLAAYRDLDWHWLRDQARLRNAQNRLGYTLHLALQLKGACDSNGALLDWECELEAARLAGEGTLCRDSMPERERAWLRVHRPKAARHWNLLTALTAEQLRNVEA